MGHRGSYHIVFLLPCLYHAQHIHTRTHVHSLLESRSLLTCPILLPLRSKISGLQINLKIKGNSTMKTISKSLHNQLLLPAFQERRTLAPPFQKYTKVLGQLTVNRFPGNSNCVSAIQKTEARISNDCKLPNVAREPDATSHIISRQCNWGMNKKLAIKKKKDDKLNEISIL